MGFGLFALMFVGGALLLAGWANFRLARFAPGNMRAMLIHIGVALVVCQIVCPATVALLVRTGSEPLRLFAVLGVALPALVYALLTLIWTISILQATLRRGMMQ